MNYKGEIMMIKTDECIVLWKDLKDKFKLTHIPRDYEDKFDPTKTFTPIENNIGYQSIINKIKYDGHKIYAPYVRKPKSGTGFWTSPLNIDNVPDWSYMYCELLEIDTFNYYDVIPHDDCRVFLVDSLESFKVFDNVYEYNYENMGNHFDLLLVVSYEVMSVMLSIENDSFTQTLISEDGLYGWDALTGLFLNEKYSIGDKHSVDLRDE